jgi:uncharacterized protein YhfF
MQGEPPALLDLRRRRPDLADLPIDEFAFPGPLRDRLVAAVLAGEKTATSSLLVEYEVEDSPLPRPGDRGIVVDSESRPLAVIETTRVARMRFDEVDLPTARDEGEGFASVADWRAAHVEFWTSREFRDAIGASAFTPVDDTTVVVTWFKVIERV